MNLGHGTGMVWVDGWDEMDWDGNRGFICTDIPSEASFAYIATRNVARHGLHKSDFKIFRQ